MILANCSAPCAATLSVGPTGMFRTPGEAALAARDGDVVTIAPGRYFDCAVWSADDLVVQGAAADPGMTDAGDTGGAVLTDRACQGKAAFVVRGHRVTLRDLTFTRIRVADGNGAGIRAEGGDLTVERGRFIDNQVGILVADATAATVTLRDCDFWGNGLAPESGPAAAGATADILAGRIARLLVERSRLRDAKGGPSITSRAGRTEIVDSRIEAGRGGRLYVVGLPDGGGLAMRNDEIVLTGVLPRLGVVWITGQGGEATLRGLVLVNRAGAPAVLLRDWGGADPVLADNVLADGDVAVSTRGVTLYRLKQAAHRSIDWSRAMAGRLRRAVSGVLHGLSP